MQFCNIKGIDEDKIIVTSKSGEIRFYDKIGGNCLNKIPSLFGDETKFVDHTKDGRFVLLTFENYLVFCPTFNFGQSVFKKNFMNANKPQPVKLSVHLNIMQKLKLKKLNLKKSYFNEFKDKKESHIIAFND